MTIRQARDEDNQALQQLQARCPQGTTLVVSTVNTPDFFGRVRTYERVLVLVAEDQGRIVGSAAAAVRPGRVGNAVVPVGYQFQAFVDPDHRRQGVADALLDRLDEYLQDQGAVLAYCLIMDGNDPSMGLVERRGFARHRELVMSVLPIFRDMSIQAEGEIRPAREDDLEAVAALISETRAGTQLSHPISAGELSGFLERTPGLALDQLLVHEIQGELAAAAAWWDWSEVMRVQVLAASRRMRRLGRWSRLVRFFRPVPPIPRPGQVLRQVMLTVVAWRDRAALAALFRDLNNRLKPRGIKQMFVVSEPDSPPVAALEGFFRVPTSLFLYVRSLSSEARLSPGPVFVDGVDL